MSLISLLQKSLNILCLQVEQTDKTAVYQVWSDGGPLEHRPPGLRLHARHRTPVHFTQDTARYLPPSLPAARVPLDGIGFHSLGGVGCPRAWCRVGFRTKKHKRSVNRVVKIYIWCMGAFGYIQSWIGWWGNVDLFAFAFTVQSTKTEHNEMVSTRDTDISLHIQSPWSGGGAFWSQILKVPRSA